MAKVRLLNGKPLMVGGKVALSDDCCCGTPVGPCGVAPCHAIGEIDFTVAGDHYGSGAFFIDDDFTVIDDHHLTISLSTTMVIHRTSDDVLCTPQDGIVGLTINATCNDETKKWQLGILISIPSNQWNCAGSNWPTDGFVSEGDIDLGTLPDDVSVPISGSYTIGTLTGTATLTIGAVCPPKGACVLPCPTPCVQRTEAGCANIGGTWQGAGSSCPAPTGACEFESDPCAIMTEAACADAGGFYDGDCSECP